MIKSGTLIVVRVAPSRDGAYPDDANVIPYTARLWWGDEYGMPVTDAYGPDSDTSADAGGDMVKISATHHIYQFFIYPGESFYVAASHAGAARELYMSIELPNGSYVVGGPFNWT